MNKILETISLFKPYDIDIPKKRFGPKTDGGYVLADTIQSDQAIVSYGISTEYQFDREMAEKGHKVYMFDHTIDSIDRTNENMMWFKEGVSGKTTPEENLFTIEDHLNRYEILGNQLILKIDVEGAELEAFFAMPDEVLSRFDQIVMELHHLWKLAEPDFCELTFKVFSKINKLFTLFHVHANNWDGHNGILVVDGFPISNFLELSYIKTSKVNRSESNTLYPTEYDYPSTNQKEKLLWFYPFIPTKISDDAFKSSYARIESIFSSSIS